MAAQVRVAEQVGVAAQVRVAEQDKEVALRRPEDSRGYGRCGRPTWFDQFGTPAVARSILTGVALFTAELRSTDAQGVNVTSTAQNSQLAVISDRACPPHLVHHILPL